MKKFHSLLVLGLLPLLSVPSYAGGWQIQYTASGSDTHDGDDNDDGQGSPRAWDVHPIGSVAQGWNWWDGTERYTHNASQSASNGSVDCTFTWVPAAGKTIESDPPPAELKLIEHTRVGAFDAMDGQGFRDDRVQPTISVERPKNATSIPHIKGKEYEARNLHSFPVPSDGVVHLTQKSFSVSCSVTDPDNDAIQPATRVQYSWTEDTRSVRLTRVGAHHERVDGDTTHGDTTYSYRLFNNTNSFANETNTQNFIASIDGGWTQHEIDYGYGTTPILMKGTDHQWSPESDHPKGSEHWRQADYDMPLGNLSKLLNEGWRGSPSGQSEKQVTYTVKDNRNNEGEITAEAKYVLHIHDPLEVSHESTEAVSVNVMLYNSDGQSIVTPNDPNGVDAGDVTVGTGTSSSTGWSFGGSLDQSFIAGFLKVLKLDLRYSVTNAETVSTTARLGFDLQPGEKAYAMVTHEYTRHHKYVYKYDQGGRNVRMGRGALDGHEDPSELKEVPHEVFADEGPTSVSPPFWMGPIRSNQVPPVTPNTVPPFQSTYTS